jgi:hypothetical protein
MCLLPHVVILSAAKDLLSLTQRLERRASRPSNAQRQTPVIIATGSSLSESTLLRIRRPPCPHSSELGLEKPTIQGPSFLSF